MKANPTPEAHPISYSLWARGCLSPFNTTAVTNVGQETVPATGFSQQLGAVHRSQTSYAAAALSSAAMLCQGVHFSTAFPGGTT